MTFGSLFAGIGGLDLGLERSGLRCKWQVEINSFSRRVLEKHWPDVRRHDDILTFPPNNPEDWSVDLIAGGFPCQDLSRIGKRAGIDGERSGLWSEFARVIRILRPRYVVVENTPGLLDSGLGRVLGDLSSLGFDAEWQTFPAAALGAFHVRDRVWVVAHARGQRLEEGISGRPATRPVERTGRADPGLDSVRVLRELPLHDPRNTRLRMRLSPDRGIVCQSLRGGPGRPIDESPVCRVGDRVPHRVDRLRALGNSVVPQVAQWIGRRLMECQASEAKS